MYITFVQGIRYYLPTNIFIYIGTFFVEKNII